MYQRANRYAAGALRNGLTVRSLPRNELTRVLKRANETTGMDPIQVLAEPELICRKEGIPFERVTQPSTHHLGRGQLDGLSQRFRLFHQPCLTRRFDGYAHASIRMDLDVVALLSRLAGRGLTQHFAIVHGSVTSLLRAWCGLMGVEFCCEE